MIEEALRSSSSNYLNSICKEESKIRVNGIEKNPSFVLMSLSFSIINNIVNDKTRTM